MDLHWLPTREDWDADLRAAKDLPPQEAFPLLRDLANSRMEFTQLLRLDRTAQKLISPDAPRVRLAILGSSTTAHLVAGIRVAGLRRGLAIEVYETPYGMYRQELMNAGSGLHKFRPDAVLLALDARHLVAEGAPAEAAIDLMETCWRQAKANFRCQVLQQAVLPVFPNLLGDNEARLPGSPAAVIAAINARLREASEAESVDVLALDTLAAETGINAWHDAALWHRSKHEITPAAAALYGDHVARLITAACGKSYKALVLDLDNTLWGGVIGDDGLEGIVLGQGSGGGEAFAEFQRYAKSLAARGVVLAVCSKNDEPNALAPFTQHPEMVLTRGDIACFVANWTDKAANLRTIAKQLNLGLDALVFVDDNPVERALIRRELPMVAVPEMPEEPAYFAQTIAAAGYFEALHLTAEDRLRCAQYQANSERAALLDTATDMASYLDSLRMTLTAQPVDAMSLARVTQLVNKTNQFNLTTERLTELEVAARSNDPHGLALQFRLTDRFGDNGIIAVIMARVQGAEATIESWLMSCRVLGRRVEEACLQVLAEHARSHGAKRLVGRYIPTAKNAMVADLYPRLGFVAEQDAFKLELAGLRAPELPMQIESVMPVTA